jgi:hypothetical protein
MRSGLVIISKIRRQNATEVRLVEDDYVVKTLAADRANDPLDVWIIKKQSTAPAPLGRAQTFQVTHVFHPVWPK